MMSSVIWHITMSLDGFIAGPNDSMDWAVREWSDDGANTRDIEVDRSAMADEVLRSAGATSAADAGTTSRNGCTTASTGSTGANGAAPCSCSRTERRIRQRTKPSRSCRRRPVRRCRRARTAADGKNVVIFGANLAQPCLREGLLDEIVIHLAPVLLGEGVRLYESIGTDPIVLTRTEVASTGQLTDLRFRV